jgi:hypothetical protein
MDRWACDNRVTIDYTPPAGRPARSKAGGLIAISKHSSLGDAPHAEFAADSLPNAMPNLPALFGEDAITGPSMDAKGFSGANRGQA